MKIVVSGLYSDEKYFLDDVERVDYGIKEFTVVFKDGTDRWFDSTYYNVFKI